MVTIKNWRYDGVMKDTIRFPLRINNEKSKEIDEAVYRFNSKSLSKISKHQFIMDAIEEKIQKQKGAI